MSFHSQFEKQAAFLIRLDQLKGESLHDTIMNEAMETGGTFCGPRNNQSHLWEIDLHGVSATGDSDDEAIRNWKRAARTVAGNHCIGHF